MFLLSESCASQFNYSPEKMSLQLEDRMNNGENENSAVLEDREIIILKDKYMVIVKKEKS